MGRKQKYGDQTGDSLLLCLTTTKLTGNEVLLLQNRSSTIFHSSNPCHNTYICLMSRNLDSRTTSQRITLDSEYIIHESRLYFMSFPDSRSVYHAKPLPEPTTALRDIWKNKRCAHLMGQGQLECVRDELSFVWQESKARIKFIVWGRDMIYCCLS